MSFLQIVDLGFSFGKKQVLRNISFSQIRGEFIGLIGLNGSGKTTLLKLIQRTYCPEKGAVLLDSKNLKAYSDKELARKITGVAQRFTASFDFTVKQFVLLGRTPYLNIWKRPTPDDEEIVNEVMAQTDCLKLKDSSILKLSSGELQRVCIAAALAQQPEILLLDEPTNSLDLRQQTRFSSLIDRLQRQGITIVCASHDLHFLRKHADQLLFLHKGFQLEFAPVIQVLESASFLSLVESESPLEVSPPWIGRGVRGG